MLVDMTMQTAWPSIKCGSPGTSCPTAPPPSHTRVHQVSPAHGSSHAEGTCTGVRVDHDRRVCTQGPNNQMRTGTHTHIRGHTHACTCRLHMHTHVHICKHVHIRVHTCAHMHTYAHTHTYVDCSAHMGTCGNVHTHAHMCTHVCAQCTHMWTALCTQAHVKLCTHMHHVQTYTCTCTHMQTVHTRTRTDTHQQEEEAGGAAVCSRVGHQGVGGLESLPQPDRPQSSSSEPSAA